MKLLLVALALFLAVSAHEPITTNYHATIGIAAAARIKNAESALDFDGSRIIGGSPAALGQYPYLGGLVISLTSGATSVCGSSLLTNTRAVTAAHCWWDGDNQARQFVVVFGSTLLFSGGTRVTTSNVQMHANYDFDSLNNDIAMITLSWVSFSNNVRSIPIATGSNTFAGSWAQAAGFGRTGENQGISLNQFLSHVTVQIITNAVCRQTYGNSILDSTLCTSTAGRQGTCDGDSGGPLVVSNQLVGVTSFGARVGCERGFPAGFARVTYFASWIQARL